MFKKTIKFEDFNGQMQVKEFYFHLSKADLLSMAADGDSFKKRVEKMIETKDMRAVLAELRAIVEMSAGVRSEDGNLFIKTREAQSELLDSPAYDELLFDLLNDPNGAADFIKQLIPAKMQAELEKEIQKQQAGTDEDDRPAYQKEKRKPNRAEFEAMTKAEMAVAMNWSMDNLL